MKRVTASDARNDWFRLLDEVVAGEIVVIERKGHRVLLQRDSAGAEQGIPDYTELLSGGDIDQADRWSWEWDPDSETGLQLRDGRPTGHTGESDR